MEKATKYWTISKGINKWLRTYQSVVVITANLIGHYLAEAAVIVDNGELKQWWRDANEDVTNQDI